VPSSSTQGSSFDADGALMLGNARQLARGLMPLAVQLRDHLRTEMAEGELRVDPIYSVAEWIHTKLNYIAYPLSSVPGQDWVCAYFPNDASEPVLT
jgi:hypothetical protein